MPSLTSLLSEIKTFLLRHWLHALLCVPGVFLVTLLHEAAHAGAVWLQGGQVLEFVWLPDAGQWGQVLEFVWLPDAGQWGHVRYDFPHTARFSYTFIGAAPYLVWLLLALLAGLLSLRRAAYPLWAASSIFFWLYVVPLADVANTAFPYLRGSSNDFARVFGAPTTPLTTALVVVGVVAAVWAGFGVHQRLYRQAALSKTAYLILAGVTLLGLAFATHWLFGLARWIVRLL